MPPGACDGRAGATQRGVKASLMRLAMAPLLRRNALVAAAVVICAAHAAAQRVPVTSDTTFARAQQLAGDGNPAAARAIVDSVLTRSTEGTPRFIEALYWRATLADSADRARRDYLRIALEYSLSPRAEDALLRLAQMDMARGNRAAAKRFLERLEVEHPNGASRAQASYWLGRVQLDDGATLQACAALADAKAHVSAGDVELGNQIAYYSRPCVAAQRAADAARADSAAKLAAAAKADSTAKADSASRADSVAREAAVRHERPRAKGPAWSVQIAAFASEEDASRLAKRLVARGYEARVTALKPYRVRIGRYARRDEAVTLAEKLKAAKTTAIVVEAEKP